MDLKEYIRDVADFPRAGVLFRDIAPLLASPKAFEYCISLAARQVEKESVDAILAIESRGFLFAAPLALRLGLPLVLARKMGKLPGKCAATQYGLEYGTGTLEVQADALKTDDRVLIVDDVLATGGTAAAAETLVEMGNAHVAAFLFIIELGNLKGRGLLADNKVYSLVEY